MECFEKIFTLTILEKSFNLDVWHNSKYALGSTYARVLNILRFWLCNYYEYALGSTYDRLRNISGLQICQGSEYATLHRVLNMLEHAWIRLNNCGISMNIQDFLLICFECVNKYTCMYSQYDRVLNKTKVKGIQGRIPAWIYFKKQSFEYARALNIP